MAWGRLAKGPVPWTPLAMISGRPWARLWTRWPAAVMSTPGPKEGRKDGRRAGRRSRKSRMTDRLVRVTWHET